MKKSTHLLIASILAGCITSCSSGKRIAQHRIVTNPMNLNYRFQPKDESRREAADPVLEYFKRLLLFICVQVRWILAL